MKRIILPSIFLIFVIFSAVLVAFFVLPRDKRAAILNVFPNNNKISQTNCNGDCDASPQKHTAFSDYVSKEFRPTQKDINELTTGKNETFKDKVDGWYPQDSTQTIYFKDVIVKSVDLVNKSIILEFSNGLTREFFTSGDANAFIGLIGDDGTTIVEIDDVVITSGNKVLLAEETDISDIHYEGRKFYILLDGRTQ